MSNHSIMEMTDSVLSHVPKPADGWTVYKQTAPKPGAEPPWVIEKVSTNDHLMSETMRVHSGIARLEIRIVSTSANAVNVLADDLMIPQLSGHRFVANGFDIGALVLDSDSGAYDAGLTSDSTSLLYQCRVLRFRFNWSRI